MMDNNSTTNIGEKKGPVAYLSPLAVIALSFGYAVGWGSFVLPGTLFLPNAGPAGSIIGLLIGTATIVVLAFNYHKVTTGIQGIGGTYGFITKTFGYNHGFLVGWFLFLTYVAILWANATALVLLARYLFGDAFQFGFHYTVAGFDVYFGEVLLCLASIVLCGCVCLYRKRFAIRLHIFCAFVLFFGVLICFIAALTGHHGGIAEMGPAFSTVDSPLVQILRIFAMIPWAFVGFEAIVQSSSEFRFPVKRTFSLLLVAVLISALTYLLLLSLPLLALPEGYSNWKEYIDALPKLKGIDAMPVFMAAKRALGPFGVAVIGGAMLSALLTSHFATHIAVSRLMHAMAEDNMIPKWLGKCNKEGTPVNAILTVIGISFPIPFLGRTIIACHVDLSNLGAAIAYAYISAAALALLKKEGKGGRPIEKATGVFGLAISIVFSLLILVPNYLSGSSLSTESYLLLVIWCFVGFILYRRVFIMDTQGRFGKSTIVWVTVLIVIFFSSLMWFHLAVFDSAEHVFREYVGKTITEDIAQSSIDHVNADMLIKSMIELCILVFSLAIMLNLFSILRQRENNLAVEKIKAEESANKSKSYFFSTISHDIRTPLNAIIGYSQMIEMSSSQEERQQAIRLIKIGGKALIRIIDGAIDFAKLEDGRLELLLKPTNCTKLVLNFMDSFRNANQNQSVEFRCRSDEMPTVLIDPKRIRQILFNLVDNAAKFTQQGFVEVRASFDRDADADMGTIRFEVEDTGCGISKEDLKQITSPYVQVDSKMARHGGTGLGLAICRKLTGAMGGELSIDSTLGKGSVFTVTISNVKVTNDAPVEEYEPAIDLNVTRTNVSQLEPATAAKEEKPVEPAASKRILIVDDRKVNLMVLKTMLKKMGAQDVVTAKDGKEALDILTSADRSFALVLTDMWMPVMDGEGLVRAIRANERLAAIPVHVVTADTEMESKYGRIGFDGFILKPVTVEKLKAIIG